MINVLLARRINGLMGGVVIAPWQVDELPDVTVDAILALEKVPEVQNNLEAVKARMAELRVQNG